jgi:HEAT repeat protein
VVTAVVAVGLIGWLTARYLVKRQLLRSLGTNDMQVRVEAARRLLAMKKLEDSLPAQAIIIRSKTAQALGEIKTKETGEAIRVLGVILRDQEEAPRRWAREALVKHGKRAVPVLMEALAAGGGTLEEAVTGLQQIGPIAAPELRLLLSDRSAYKGASQALSKKMGKMGVEALLSACYMPDADVREKALADLGAAKVRAVIKPALDNLDPKLKLSPGAGIRALGQIGDPIATMPIIPFLKNSDNRSDAAISLGLIGDARAVEPLLATLTEKEKSYRGAAIAALNRVVRKSGSAAYPPVVRDLKSPNVLLRRACAAALAGANSASLNPPLTAAVRDPDSEVRASAATALGWEGNLQGVRPLVGALNDPEWRVVEAAVSALGNIGPKAMPELMSVIATASGEAGTTLCYEISLAFSAMGSRAVRPLIAALSNPNPQVQKWAAVALGDIRDLSAVGPLKQLAARSRGDLKWVAQEQLRLLTGATGS